MCVCVVSLYLSATETTCHSTMLLWQPTIGEYEKDREVSRVMDASCLPSDLNMMKGECQRAEGGGGESLSVASLAHLEWKAAFQPNTTGYFKFLDVYSKLRVQLPTVSTFGLKFKEDYRNYTKDIVEQFAGPLLKVSPHYRFSLSYYWVDYVHSPTLVGLNGDLNKVIKKCCCKLCHIESPFSENPDRTQL